jgi:aryl-alcohol dehydrogenase-like predicted oxidoreductase
MNRFILGTVQFGLKYGINNMLGQPNRNTVNEIFNLAHKLGISTLDSAEAYGNAHQLIGDFHFISNFEFKINTKFNSIEKEEIKDRVKNTCELLNIKKINVCFFHSFRDYLNKTLHQEFESLITLDFVDQIGVSVYTNEEFNIVINDPIVKVIQCPFNLFDNFHQRGDLILKAKEKGKKIQIRSIFLQGLFFSDPNYLKGNLVEFKDDILFLRKLTSEFQISISDLCLQYVLSFKEIDEIIIGVDTPSQLISNSIGCLNTIPSELVNRINSIQIKNISLLYPYNWK